MTSFLAWSSRMFAVSSRSVRHSVKPVRTPRQEQDKVIAPWHNSALRWSGRHCHGRLGTAVSRVETGILFLLKTSCSVTDTQSHHHEDPGSKWVRCGRDGLVQSSLAQKHTARTVRWTDVQLGGVTLQAVCDMIPASMRGVPPCKTKKA